MITIWSKDRHDANFIQERIDEYNETNTDNVQVEYELYTDNFEQAVDLAAQSGELPDILKLQDQVYNKYVNQGQWADLYQYMDDDMKEYFKDHQHKQDADQSQQTAHGMAFDKAHRPPPGPPAFPW